MKKANETVRANRSAGKGKAKAKAKGKGNGKGKGKAKEQEQRSVERLGNDQTRALHLPIDPAKAVEQVDAIKYFLVTAPVGWQQGQVIRRCALPGGELISCVKYNGLFYITGTDIIRCLAFRFQLFGRPVVNAKQFEEGVFADLRRLKLRRGACLEPANSEFLQLLYQNGCVKTQRMQKVYYWYSVPHDRLFIDALERDLRRDRLQTPAATRAVTEPALSFRFDPAASLYDQLVTQPAGIGRAALLPSEESDSSDSEYSTVSSSSSSSGSGHGVKFVGNADAERRNVFSEYTFINTPTTMEPPTELRIPSSLPTTLPSPRRAAMHSVFPSGVDLDLPPSQPDPNVQPAEVQLPASAGPIRSARRFDSQMQGASTNLLGERRFASTPREQYHALTPESRRLGG